MIKYCMLLVVKEFKWYSKSDSLFHSGHELMFLVTCVLKPQDSFGEFDNFFLDLQKVQEIIRKHHQTFLQLFLMTL